ncbi:MAG: 8-amino-7-oxononanoate synthase [Alphaproteobacteria bacterium]|nr:8-amino-7-oxononanoate synthase [Alphaproteobacteria bacterium]
MGGTIDDFARAKLASIAHHGLLRTIKDTDCAEGMAVTRGGERLISFCSNDYLGLAQNAEVRAAAKAAVDRYGAGAGASRLVTGNHPLYDVLEEKLARLKGAEAACVFGSGYLANIGIIPCFAAAGDIILADELYHSCMERGARLSGAQTVLFAHNDTQDLARKLAEHRPAVRHALIITEGVFSMDGDLAPLPAIMELAAAHDAWLLTDDAHGFGVLGGGRGSAAHWNVKPHLQMGTLSKAAGSYGGYVCGGGDVIAYIKNKARSLIYSTALPPATLGAAIKALELIEADAMLAQRALGNAKLFCSLAGLPVPQSTVVPVLYGAEEAALAASQRLEAQGFLVAAIRPPTVPRGTARLRLTFSATHAEGDIRRLAAALAADAGQYRAA